MRPFKSLKRRIIVAYLLFALVASIFFAIIAAVAVEGIEVRLVDERLKEVAAWASPRHAAGLSVEMPAGLSFHHAEDTPLPLHGLTPGMHEKTVDGVDLHVLWAAMCMGNSSSSIMPPSMKRSSWWCTACLPSLLSVS